MKDQTDSHVVAGRDSKVPAMAHRSENIPPQNLIVLTDRKKNQLLLFVSADESNFYVVSHRKWVAKSTSTKYHPHNNTHRTHTHTHKVDPVMLSYYSLPHPLPPLALLPPLSLCLCSIFEGQSTAPPQPPAALPAGLPGAQLPLVVESPGVSEP